VGCADGFHLVLCPANLGSGVRRFTPTTGRPEEGDSLRVWIYPTVAISYASGELYRLRAKSGDINGRGLLGQGVETGVLDGVVLAIVAPRTPFQEEAHHVYGFLKHFQPHVGRRPAVSEDVLVEILT
jgi:hypothetical protein